MTNKKIKYTSIYIYQFLHICKDNAAFLAHTKQKVSNIVGLTALRLAFFMRYEYHKVVQWFLY